MESLLKENGKVVLNCDGSVEVSGFHGQEEPVRHEPGSPEALAFRDAAGGDLVLGPPRESLPNLPDDVLRALGRAYSKATRRITKIDHKTRTVTYE